MLRLHSNPVMTRFQAQYGTIGTIGTWESKWESTENLSSMPFGIPRETLGDSWLCRLCYPMNPKNLCRGAVGHPLFWCWSMLIHVDPLFYSFLMFLWFLLLFLLLLLLSGSLLSFNRKFSFNGAKIWPQQSVLVKRPVGGNLLLDFLAQWNLTAWWPRDERFWIGIRYHPMTLSDGPERGHFPSDFFGWLSRYCVEMCALSESLNFEGTKLKHLQQCSGRLRDTQLGICWHGVIVWYRRGHKGLFRNQVTAFRSCRNSQILMFALHWCFGKESWQMGAGCRDPGLSRAWIDHLQLCRSVVGWKVSKGFKRHFVSLCFTVPSFVMTLWDFLAASRGLEILRNMHAATLAPLALHPPALEEMSKDGRGRSWRSWRSHDDISSVCRSMIFRCVGLLPRLQTMLQFRVLSLFEA